ncbi:MAG TPA: hypothetical protein VF801_11535, partial [Rhodocyclaceae bacterium]
MAIVDLGCGKAQAVPFQTLIGALRIAVVDPGGRDRQGSAGPNEAAAVVQAGCQDDAEIALSQHLSGAVVETARADTQPARGSQHATGCIVDIGRRVEADVALGVHRAAVLHARQGIHANAGIAGHGTGVLEPAGRGDHHVASVGAYIASVSDADAGFGADESDLIRVHAAQSC